MESTVASLDLFLFTCGIIIYVGYNLFHFYIYCKFPSITSLSWEIEQRKSSVDSIFQVEPQDRDSFAAELTGKTASANTHAAYTWIILSLTAVLSGIKIYHGDDKGEATGIVERIVIAVLSLLALLCFYGSSRILNNATFLITIPQGRVQVTHVKCVVVRGIVLLKGGYRLFDLALALLPWFIWSIPMIIAVLTLVVLQCINDFNVPAEVPEPELELV